jgi:hypothetical protein
MMAYTAPNTFSSGAVISAADVQANINALQDYCNGGISASDISGEFVEPKHIMKGIYFPIDNSYEMITGFYKGPALSDLPVHNPGYMGRFVAAQGSDRAAVPGTGITFHIEDNADILICLCIHPIGLNTNDTELKGNFDIRLDGATNNATRQFYSKETDVETAGAGVALPGFYRRRPYYIYSTHENVTKGFHTFQVFGDTNIRSVALKNYSYSIKAFYR